MDTAKLRMAPCSCPTTNSLKSRAGRWASPGPAPLDCCCASPARQLPAQARPSATSQSTGARQVHRQAPNSVRFHWLPATGVGTVGCHTGRTPLSNISSGAFIEKQTNRKYGALVCGSIELCHCETQHPGKNSERLPTMWACQGHRQLWLGTATPALVLLHQRRWPRGPSTA